MCSFRLGKSRSGSEFRPLGERYRHDLSVGGSQDRRLGFLGRCRAFFANWLGQVQARGKLRAAGSQARNNTTTITTNNNINTSTNTLMLTLILTLL